MANIRINALPSDASPTQTDVLPIDGSTTRKATIKQVAEIGRPAASQAEAEAGTDPTKAMTPLTVKQSIAAEVGSTIASKAQGDKADSAMQPATYDPQAIGGDAFARANHTGTQSADTITDGTTNKAYTGTEQSKLAKAVTNDATDASTFGFVLDEDDMASDSDQKVPTQQSVKAYVNNHSGGVGYINPEDYGLAVGGSAADNAAALVAALTAAAGAPVMIPAKSYALAGVEYQGPIHLIGQGIKTRLTFTGAGAGLHLPISSTIFGAVIGNFTMNQEIPGGGTHGIHVEMLTGGYFGKWTIFNVFNDLGGDRHQFGDSAIYLDNSAQLADGLATGRISGCQLTSGDTAGILGDFVGDSIKIKENVVNDGIGIAVSLKQVSGARQIAIEDNNLTTRGGAILLHTCGQSFVNRNWMEHPAYLGEFSTAAGVDAQCTLFNSYNVYAEHNTVRSGAGDPGPDSNPITGASYGVLLDGTTTLSKVRENWIAACAVARTFDNSSGTNTIADNIDG